MRSDEISQLMQERIDANDFPSAVYLVAEKGEIVYQDALGYAVVVPESIEAKIDTIYDIASLTKPLVTGLLAARLIERGQLDLARTIEYYLQEFNTPDTYQEGQWNISVRQLLAHTSLLPAWKPFYLLVQRREEVLREIARTPVDRELSGVTYSDLNFLVLTFLIERLRGQGLDAIARVEIFDKLDLQSTFFNPPETVKARIAASEMGNAYEKSTCFELGYLKPPAVARVTDSFRDYQIWGEVHDGNAWFMGGVAGHAGLFSTAEDVFKIALQFLPNYSELLNPDTCDLFRTNFTKGLNEDRSFAFQLASTKNSTAGTKMSPESFGHLGFTGTSLWIDPVKDRIFILLTNRTHAHPLPFVNINSVRRRFHDLAIGLLDENK